MCAAFDGGSPLNMERGLHYAISQCFLQLSLPTGSVRVPRFTISTSWGSFKRRELQILHDSRRHSIKEEMLSAHALGHKE